MIQTADQYVFLYRTFIEGILSNGTTMTAQEFLNIRKFPMDIKTQYKVLRIIENFDQSMGFVFLLFFR